MAIIDWKEHLLNVVRHSGMGQTKFEELCGLSRGFLAQPRKDVTASALLKIHSKFPDVNPVWLAFGEGDMISQTAQQPSHDYKEISMAMATLVNENSKLKTQLAILQAEKGKMAV